MTRTPRAAAGAGEYGKVLGKAEITLRLRELFSGAIRNNPLRLSKSVPQARSDALQAGGKGKVQPAMPTARFLEKQAKGSEERNAPSICKRGRVCSYSRCTQFDI